MTDEILFGYPPLPWALERMAALDDQEFHALREVVAGPDGYERNLPRCEMVARRLHRKVEPREAFHLLGALRFLYERCREWERTGRDSQVALHEFLEFTGLSKKLGKDSKTGSARLTELVGRNPVIERRRKIRWLRTGILESAVSFASFVDLRPRIADDRSAVEELVPVVVLRVLTESDHGREEAHVFQLTKEGVAKLRAVVEDIEKKLAAVSADASLGPRLQTGTTDEREEEDELFGRVFSTGPPGIPGRLVGLYEAEVRESRQASELAWRDKLLSEAFQNRQMMAVLMDQDWLGVQLLGLATCDTPTPATKLAVEARASFDAAANVLARLVQSGALEVESDGFVRTARGDELIQRFEKVSGAKLRP